MLKHNNTSDLLDYSDWLAHAHRQEYSLRARKPRGQIFTPASIAQFMAKLVTFSKESLKVLDPGAGTGILMAALCDQVVKTATTTIHLTIDAYENDQAIQPKLQAVLTKCQATLNAHGHRLEYTIFDTDFITRNAHYFNAPLLFGLKQTRPQYDVVLANPPYYKLNKDSPQARMMSLLVHGQPNIYALFIALAVYMLKLNGQAVFITPRSFCSGLYYQRFRAWFLRELHLTRLHIFESRAAIFDDDDVLQENIILHAIKIPSNTTQAEHKLYISSSPDKSFQDMHTLAVPLEQVIVGHSDDLTIRIPVSTPQLDSAQMVDAWPQTLHSLGFEISTGPVVAFRAETYLCQNMNGQAAVPLLWMHNIRDGQVVWPLAKNGKAPAILDTPGSHKLLLPVSNYVVLKRFSAKEQPRRLYAAVFLQSAFDAYPFIGLENHLNYIHRPKGTLTVEEVYGLTALLNTSLIDNYFRAMNGNTQVNASDLRRLPLPSHENIITLGKCVMQKSPPIGAELDQIVADILHVGGIGL